jgi:hypothetical protein
VNLHELKPGDRLRTEEGSIVEVVAETEDGRWIAVKYLRIDHAPELIGTPDLCTADELVEKVTSRFP